MRHRAPTTTCWEISKPKEGSMIQLVDSEHSMKVDCQGDRMALPEVEAIKEATAARGGVKM